MKKSIVISLVLCLTAILVCGFAVQGGHLAPKERPEPQEPPAHADVAILFVDCPQTLVARRSGLVANKNWTYDGKDEITVALKRSLASQFLLAGENEACDYRIKVSIQSMRIEIKGTNARVLGEVRFIVTNDQKKTLFNKMYVGSLEGPFDEQHVPDALYDLTEDLTKKFMQEFSPQETPLVVLSKPLEVTLYYDKKDESVTLEMLSNALNKAGFTVYAPKLAEELQLKIINGEADASKIELGAIEVTPYIVTFSRAKNRTQSIISMQLLDVSTGLVLCTGTAEAENSLTAINNGCRNAVGKLVREGNKKSIGE